MLHYGLWGVFASMVLISVLGFIKNNPIGLIALVIACSVLVILLAIHLFSRYGEGRVYRQPHVRAVPRPAEHGVFQGFWSAIGNGLVQNAWLVGGIAFAILSVICIIALWHSDEKANLAILAFFFAVSSLFGFLMATNTLGETLTGWIKHGLPATGLLISLGVTTLLAYNASQEGDVWWKTASVLAWAFITFQFGLKTFGFLGDFWKAIGNGLSGALSNRFGVMVTLLSWFFLLLFSGLLANYVGKFETFEKYEDVAKVGELFALSAFTTIFVGGFACLVYFLFSRKK